jgi:hypothetical protein
MRQEHRHVGVVEIPKKDNVDPTTALTVSSFRYVAESAPCCSVADVCSTARLRLMVVGWDWTHVCVASLL